MTPDEPQYRQTDKTTAFRKFLQQLGSYKIFQKTKDQVFFYGGNKLQRSNASETVKCIAYIRAKNLRHMFPKRRAKKKFWRAARHSLLPQLFVFTLSDQRLYTGCV